MNPIKHVWFLLDEALRKQLNKLTSAASLLVALKEEWAAIPQEKINNLILSVSQCVSDLFNAKGRSTRY